MLFKKHTRRCRMKNRIQAVFGPLQMTAETHQQMHISQTETSKTNKLKNDTTSYR